MYLSDDVGDNIEFIAVNTGNYTINFSTINTDSEFVKNATIGGRTTPILLTARTFSLRTDQNVNIIGMNDKTFTNPISVIQNKEHVEKRNNPFVIKLLINVPTTNTKISIRWF